MDRLFSVFSLYDFVSYVLVGATVITGAYWALEGVPDEPGASTVFALIAASYIAGQLVQAVGILWEHPYWKLRGGWPSDRRLKDGDSKAYPDSLRDLIRTKIADQSGADKNLETRHLFYFARADLRSRGSDVRAETMNALYALSRGLTTAAALLLAPFIAVWIIDGDTDRMLPAAAVVLVATALFLLRFERFGYFFADQVWRDYAATSGSKPPGNSAQAV